MKQKDWMRPKKEFEQQRRVILLTLSLIQILALLFNSKILFSAGCRCLQADGIKNITVETFEDAESAAEGSHLGVWKFQEFKTKKDNGDIPEIVNYDKKSEYVLSSSPICMVFRNGLTII